jgi:hydroxymethylbilane synthase
MPAPIKLGTRESQLALWQARHVQQLLEKQGVVVELVPLKSDGELDLHTPLYEMNVQGIFTKALDLALLRGQIDLAVHSLKDVPTQLAAGLVLAATPARAHPHDVLVAKSAQHLPHPDQPYTVATSSLRRQAQWLHRYPQHQVASLRGNINTRLQKLVDSPTWSGALFAAAGLARIGLAGPHHEPLAWMLPAPAQGALAVVCRQTDHALREICAGLDHPPTRLATGAERQFLRTLMGGCSLPVAALAQWRPSGHLHFAGNLLTPNGRQKAEVSLTFAPEQAPQAGQLAAEALLANGGAAILAQLRSGGLAPVG